MSCGFNNSSLNSFLKLRYVRYELCFVLRADIVRTRDAKRLNNGSLSGVV